MKRRTGTQVCVTPGPVTVTILLVATFVSLCLRGLVSSPFHTLSAEVCRQEMFHLCCVSSFYSQCAETGVCSFIFLQDDIFRGSLNHVSRKRGRSTGCLWPPFGAFCQRVEWSGTFLGSAYGGIIPSSRESRLSGVPTMCHALC